MKILSILFSMQILFLVPSFAGTPKAPKYLYEISRNLDSESGQYVEKEMPLIGAQAIADVSFQSPTILRVESSNSDSTTFLNFGSHEGATAVKELLENDQELTLFVQKDALGYSSYKIKLPGSDELISLEENIDEVLSKPELECLAGNIWPTKVDTSLLSHQGSTYIISSTGEGAFGLFARSIGKKKMKNALIRLDAKALTTSEALELRGQIKSCLRRGRAIKFFGTLALFDAIVTPFLEANEHRAFPTAGTKAVGVAISAGIEAAPAIPGVARDMYDFVVGDDSKGEKIKEALSEEAPPAVSSEKLH